MTDTADGGNAGDGTRPGGADDAVAASRAERMRAALTQRFVPLRLEIADESARHAGHAGVREGGAAAAAGETHYAVLLVSAAFAGVGRVQRSRLVHEALSPEFARGLHALSLTLRAPQEAVAIS